MHSQEGGVHRYTYDIAGNVLTYTDPRSNTWTRTYDAAGNLLTVTDPLNATTTFEYDDVGRVTKRIGPAPLRATTEYGYDQRDRLITVKDAAGVTRYTRDAAGRLQTLVDAAGKVLVQENVYDGEGHLLRHTDGAGNTTSYEYDGDYPGILNTVTFPTYKVRYAYDKRNRPTIETDDLGEQGTRTTRRTYTPDGLLETLTDAKNRTTAYEYDALGRETVTTDPMGGVTRLSYDDRDNVISVTNARNIVIRRYEYDRKDRLTKEIWPDGRFYQYTYDDETGITERIDAKGQKARYHHDAAGRQTRIEYFAAGSDTVAKTVTFSYDERGLLTGYNDGTTSATYSYDALGRKTGETVNYGSFSLGFGYGYDAAGRKTSFTGPDQKTVTYAYDQAGQLTTINVPDAGSFTLTDYVWGAPRRMALPGGGAREWEFDALLRPARITGKDPAGNPVLDYAYTYDPVGNILGKQTEHGAYSYGYDDLDRLTFADNPTLPDEAYSYDPVGNRLTDAKTEGIWSYSDSDELKNYGDVSLQYDLNGSLKEKNENGTVLRYVYDLENRLTEVRDGANELIAGYYYDPFGRRLWKDVGGARTYFLYADEGLIAEANSSGITTRQYGWKLDGTWGTDPLYLKAGGQAYLYQNDHWHTAEIGRLKRCLSVGSKVRIVWYRAYRYGAGRKCAEISGPVSRC